MTDASGINTDAYQAEFQAAADSLVAIFPKDYSGVYTKFVKNLGKQVYLEHVIYGE